MNSTTPTTNAAREAGQIATDAQASLECLRDEARAAGHFGLAALLNRLSSEVYWSAPVKNFAAPTGKDLEWAN